MAEQDFRSERHYELWREQNKQVARWAFGTAIFATILLLKVLAPYTEFSEKVAERQAELTRVRDELATIEVKRAALAKVGERIEAVRATIEQQPWTTEKDRLIRSLRDVNQAYRTLSNAPPAQILEAIRETQAPIPQQVPPPPLQPHRFAQATAVLQLDADQISGVESQGAFRRLLDEHARQRVQEEADDKVRRIFQRVNDDVIHPFERLLREDPVAARALPAMSPMLDRTRADMDQWVRQHLGNRDWYETIQAKDQELSQLTASLRQRQEALMGIVREQQKTLEPKKKILAERQQWAQEQATAIGNALAELNAKMQKLLPEWLRDLVSPEEMLQLYPVVLLGLVGILGFKAGVVRHHYLVVREGHRPPTLSLQDSAVSSLWTLVYRGALGTAATSAVYLGGTILLWWLFEHGSALAVTWLTGQPTTARAAVRHGLPAIRWLGRLLFATAAVGIVATLLRDRVAISSNRSAAATSSRASGG